MVIGQALAASPRGRSVRGLCGGGGGEWGFCPQSLMVQRWAGAPEWWPVSGEHPGWAGDSKRLPAPWEHPAPGRSPRVVAGLGGAPRPGRSPRAMASLPGAPRPGRSSCSASSEKVGLRPGRVTCGGHFQSNFPAAAPGMHASRGGRATLSVGGFSRVLVA